MTFLVPERTVTIELGDTAYAGAEIVVRISVPLGVYFRIDEALRGLDSPDGIDTAIGLFVAEGLVSWNLADRHGPIPPTAEGMRDHLEPTVIGGIIRAWVDEVGNVPRPLPSTSPDGSTSGDTTAKRRRRKSAAP